MSRKINSTGLFSVALALVLFGGCSPKKTHYDGMSVCHEFYLLNKNKDFSQLKDLHILDTRWYSVYDEESGRFNRITYSIRIDTDRDTFIILPTYRPGADMPERENFFSRCDSAALRYIREKYKIENREDIVFEYYQHEVDRVYREYAKIEVPGSLRYNNIPVYSYPGYFRFEVYADEEEHIYYICYLVQDSLLMDEDEKKRVLTLPSFDDQWYYRFPR